jgi:hypothetical protein
VPAAAAAAAAAALPAILLLFNATLLLQRHLARFSSVVSIILNVKAADVKTTAKKRVQGPCKSVQETGSFKSNVFDTNRESMVSCHLNLISAGLVAYSCCNPGPGYAQADNPGRDLRSWHCQAIPDAFCRQQNRQLL